MLVTNADAIAALCGLFMTRKWFPRVAPLFDTLTHWTDLSPVRVRWLAVTKRSCALDYRAWVEIQVSSARCRTLLWSTRGSHSAVCSPMGTQGWGTLNQAPQVSFRRANSFQAPCRRAAISWRSLSCRIRKMLMSLSIFSKFVLLCRSRCLLFWRFPMRGADDIVRFHRSLQPRPTSDDYSLFPLSDPE